MGGYQRKLGKVVGIARLIALLPLAALAWTRAARAEAPRDAPGPSGTTSPRKADRSGVELGLTFGAIQHMHPHGDFRVMPLGWRGGYQLMNGLYLGAAGELSIFQWPDEQIDSAAYYQVTGEVGYDYSPLLVLGAIPFVRAGYVSTFISDCEHRVWPNACDVTRDGGAIGQVGLRTIWRHGHWESGFELHYQFGTLENVGFRFSNAVRF
jgi:hypothetical protein